MKKYLYAFISILILFYLGFSGLQWLFQHTTNWLGDINGFLARTIRQTEQSYTAGLILVGVSFLYGIIHAIGPGHGKFVLSSYAIANNPKFFRLAGLALTISLLQGVTAVIVGSIALYIFKSSASRFVSVSNSLYLVAGLMLLCLGSFWLGRAIYRAIKIYRLPDDNPSANASQTTTNSSHAESGFSHHACSHSHQNKRAHSCEPNKHESDREHEPQHASCSCSNHNHESLHQKSPKAKAELERQAACSCSCHSQQPKPEPKSEHTCCSHPHSRHAESSSASAEPHEHGPNCGCGNHLDWEKFTQLDNFRDRVVMSLSVILRPCTGAVFILIFAYSVNLWWWGVASAMFMALGTGIGLLFTVQIVQFIKKLGFSKFNDKPTKRRAFFTQIFLAILALSLIMVASQAIYQSYTQTSDNRLYQRRKEAPKLKLRQPRPPTPTPDSAPAEPSGEQKPASDLTASEQQLYQAILRGLERFVAESESRF